MARTTLRHVLVSILARLVAVGGLALVDSAGQSAAYPDVPRLIKEGC